MVINVGGEAAATGVWLADSNRSYRLVVSRIATKFCKEVERKGQENEAQHLAASIRLSNPPTPSHLRSFITCIILTARTVGSNPIT